MLSKEECAVAPLKQARTTLPKCVVSSLTQIHQRDHKSIMAYITEDSLVVRAQTGNTSAHIDSTQLAAAEMTVARCYIYTTQISHYRYMH